MPYFILDGESAPRRHAEPAVSSVRLRVYWDLGEGEARAEGALSGPVVKSLGGEEPEKLLRGWAEGWCDSAEVTELRILASDAERLSYVVSLKAPLPDEDDRGRTSVDLPMPPYDVGGLIPEGMDLAQGHIDGMLFPEGPITVDLAWKVRIPGELVPLSGPSVRMTWEDLSFGAHREVAGSLLEAAYTLDWGGRSVIPEEYAGYRSLLLEATDSRLPRLVLRPAGESDEE
jgi:hypothetical protein